VKTELLHLLSVATTEYSTNYTCYSDDMLLIIRRSSWLLHTQGNVPCCPS